MKTRQDNNMTNCTSVIYVEDETKLLCLIGLGVIYDKNQTRQRRDQSIGIIFTETKIELSGLIWSSAIYDENQTGQRHDWLGK